MKNKPYFEVTVMEVKPNQKGIDRIYSEMFPDTSEPTDENGNTAEYYTNLGLPVPDNLKSKSSMSIIGQDLDLELDEIDVTYKKAIIEKSEFSFLEENVKLGSTLYTKSGFEMKIEENLDEIIKRVFG